MRQIQMQKDVLRDYRFIKQAMTQRKAWTIVEDNALKELYQDRGIKKWAEISRLLEKEFNIHHRSGKQCRQRYHNHLDSSIKREKWTPVEENKLLELHNTLGNHWAEISRSIEGRSQNCVKNQFYSILRRGLRKINKIIKERLKRFKELEIGLLYKIVQNCELSEPVHPSKNHMSSMELKRQIAFFGVSSIELSEIDTNRVKKIIQNVKFVGKNSQKKKDKINDQEQEKESEEIESEQYRDNCRPLQEVKLRRGSFYSFRLEHDEKHQPQLVTDSKPCAMPPLQPNFIKTASLQSIDSHHSPRFDLTSPKFLQSFGTEGGFDFADSRASPQGTLTCESPYFDQYRSNWYNYYQH